MSVTDDPMLQPNYVRVHVSAHDPRLRGHVLDQGDPGPSHVSIDFAWDFDGGEGWAELALAAREWLCEHFPNHVVGVNVTRNVYARPWEGGEL